MRKGDAVAVPGVMNKMFATSIRFTPRPVVRRLVHRMQARGLSRESLVCLLPYLGRGTRTGGVAALLRADAARDLAEPIDVRDETVARLLGIGIEPGEPGQPEALHHDRNEDLVVVDREVVDAGLRHDAGARREVGDARAGHRERGTTRSIAITISDGSSSIAAEARSR